ncbi:MAG: hypothetical protein VW557_05765 [Rhodospirillaceae bacterium]
MEIGYQIFVVLGFIVVLLIALYFIKSNSEKIRSFTRDTGKLIEVKETAKIDVHNRITLVSVSDQNFLLLTSKNGQNVIQKIE